MTNTNTTERTVNLARQRRPRSAGVADLSREDRFSFGKAARKDAPLDGHGKLVVDGRDDPVDLLVSQEGPRVPELIPLRHGRMLVSPFAYFRGAALPMAADLARTPSSGLRVQLCGDAHLANFGAFASPERRLVFDLNDFDESHPGPFEWDVKRLAASIVVAGRENGFSRKQQCEVVLAGVSGYRSAMKDFAGQALMQVWYARLDIEDVLRKYRNQVKKKQVKAAANMLAKARRRDSTQALGKLTRVVDGRRRIIGDPPLVVPVEDLFSEMETEALYEEIHQLIRKYARSLTPNRRHLLDQFTLVQVARKVVGVGSVGTRAWILLLEADDGEEPLFLQAKEAHKSVLAAYTTRSRYANQGQRVVTGQRLMQATSDIFLGWQRTTGPDGITRDYYVRQLRDWKLSARLETMTPASMTIYARLCGWTLARAHARSGDRMAIAGYLGRSEKFDRALLDFAEAYADLNEQDYARLVQAVADGRLEAADR